MSLNSTTYTLSSVLTSTPYTLAYALPLLMLSVLMTFAGTFLTLDRSRAFAPQDDVVRSPSSMDNTLKKVKIRLRNIFLLEGGIGGLTSGFVFGVHLSTFLALIIPSQTTQAPLSATSFLSVWVISALVCTIFAGRWKYAALTLAGTAGYSMLAVALSIIVHPSLTTRIVFTSIVTPMGMIMSLLPLQRYQHAFLRVATSSAGALGVVVTIALFVRNPSWSTVWEHLWVSNGEGWSTAKEKGLSAAYCILLLLGASVDWLLHTKLGENPDQKWDAYLSEYASTLPHEAGRAGTFAPLTSFWSRHLGYKGLDPIAKNIVFPTDADLKLPPPSPLLPQKQRSLFTPSSPTKVFEPPRRLEFLRRHRKESVPGVKRSRQAIKFKLLDVNDFSSSDDEDTDAAPKPSLERGGVRGPRVSSSRSDSIATLVNAGSSSARSVKTDGLDLDLEMQKVKAKVQTAPVLDYSDFEEDVTVSAARNKTSRDAPGWKPQFLRRARHSVHSDHHYTPACSSSPQTVVRNRSSPMAIPPTITFSPVPATSSLIRAIDHISQAQQAAHGPSLPEFSGLPQHHHAGWQSFWKDVKAAVGHAM